MFLTFLYMIATFMQARKMSFLKTHLHNIFKKEKNHSSVVLYTKLSKYTFSSIEDCLIRDPNIPKDRVQSILNGDFITPYEYKTYFNKVPSLEKILLLDQRNLKLCSVCPQQQIDISGWLAYPYGKSLFPFHMNNCCETLSAPDNIHVLIETVFGTCESQASTIAAKLEDFGVITAWTVNPDNMDFILKTDSDHITSLMIAVVREQYNNNNRIPFTCVQSVSVSGKPCTYDIEDSSKLLDENVMNIMVIDWNVYIKKLTTLSLVAQETNKENKPKQTLGFNIYPPDYITADSEKETIDSNDTEKHDTGTTHGLPASAISTQVTELGKRLESTVISLKKDTEFSKETPTVISPKKVPDDLATAQSSHAMKTKDNTVSNVDNEIFMKDIHHSKSTLEVKAPKVSFTPSKLKDDEKYSKTVKPPNVVIYADSPDTINNVKTVLEKALDPDRYIIYALSRETACSNVWVDQVALVVICGNVDSEIKTQLVEYVIHGGKLLALCSDMLHTLLPSFKTAEVRESELVHFSYGKWKHVRMMHHIFCYHASPIRARFSQDQEDTRTPGLNPPSSASVKDKRGNSHSFNVKILGTEETWHNPSILLATLADSGGKVVFSQIHLEVDPTQYEYEEDKFKALQESNRARLEIISDLLSTHLEMAIRSSGSKDSTVYTPGYFLGRYEEKIEMLKRLKSQTEPYDLLKMSNMNIQFCSNFNELQRIPPSASCLPILVHGCPDNFSTTKYFEKLDTKQLGRLVIYTDVLTSSMYVTDCVLLEHGLAVIPRQQTKGQGRSRNLWLSPVGCAMFTLQMHFDLNSFLGSRISILQHYVATAIVHAVRSKPGYENVDIRLKWPNDIYAGSSTKLGGLFVKTKIENTRCICDVGTGINFSNSKPTSCINDVIRTYNQKHGTNLQTFLYEEFFAEVFNSIEQLIDRSTEDMKFFYELYYKYWLHQDANVTVVKRDGESENVVIKCIDDFGYLLVEDKKGNSFSLHPDGNSFDLLKGLIVPK